MSNDEKRIQVKQGDYRIIKRPMKDHEFLKHYKFNWFRLPSGIFRNLKQSRVSERSNTYVTLSGDLILLDIPLNYSGVEYMAEGIDNFADQGSTTASGSHTLFVEGENHLSKFIF